MISRFVRPSVKRLCMEASVGEWLRRRRITTDLVRLAESPRALFGSLDRERGGALMAAMDACNRRFGRGTVVPARAGLEAKRRWATKFELRTPRYTTRLAEVPVVTAMAAPRPEIRPSSS
ncbi:DUF4113 domain-containing protein [Methylobacterium nodulans]|uniref:DUF4113 domain-containing protein n=1 Tax=Methylobacterium nodulans (strain LMG 21967 / CNCM I-2342 / ORS 2060) TaxID=460265 RepID=B8IIJ8_METNO|nr:hypothetical protein Mnod_3928 [Methylobacterium nodulans ORS 2060]ACL59875.1 hypothetical protein Mnod_5028 [Methylobacterium nodulans ORS 2060]